jgi:glyoxylate reductase
MTKRQTVVITSEVPEIAVAILSRRYEVDVHHADGVRTEEEMITLLSDADGAITMLSDPVTRKVLESNPNLRVVANYAVGTNNIDLDAARELGVTVTNTPGVLTDATADLAFALLLSVSRRVIEGDLMVRRGEFTGWHPLMLLGRSLRGKQLGIVGLGRIGTEVARRAVAFGMKVVYFSRSRKLAVEEELGAIALPLEELLKTSDFVSLHTPLTPETHHMIDAPALSLMKPEAFLINTGRGPVVDEAALAEALRSGRIAGAGLDVYEQEPKVCPELLGLDNVVLLPHIGTATVEARNDMARMVAEDVTAVLEGAAPSFPVVMGGAHAPARA